MRNLIFVLCCVSLALTSCSTMSRQQSQQANASMARDNTMQQPRAPVNYADRMPQSISPGARTIVVNPNVHAWGAYDKSGTLVRAGLATAGGSWCSDVKRSCYTRPGTFRIQSLGSASCKSSMYPKPRGGAPMPYCMFFNGHQGLHGSYDVVEGNVSHGCVRVQVSDAEWIRFNFANIGTKVVVKPYY